MSKLMYMTIAALLVLLPLLAVAAVDPREEIRYCTDTPARAANGKIARDKTVLAAFKKLHPCPATGKPGACPGWQVNHIIPLTVGGCDAVSNMQWLPVGVKTCREDFCVDRWERVYWVRPVHGVVK